MYRLKWALLVIFTVLPVLKTQQNLYAANTGSIDIVRKKTVLNDQDKKVIDDFVRDAVKALINERDFTNIARHRDAISNRKDNNQLQYVNQFNESTVNYITKAFDTVKNIEPAQSRAIVITNLFVLIDRLENVQFALLAMNKLDDENKMVQYWAAKCLANPALIEQLNSGKAPNPGWPEEITKKLINVVPKCSAEVLGLLAKYAAGINIPKGQELLLKIADQRIAAYANWNVKNEYEDGNILKFLANKITEPSENTNIPAAAQRFAQLFSYIIQRYVKAGSFLDNSQKLHLSSIIIDTEDKCIREMVGAQQSLRRAIESKDLNALMAEHDTLLGSNLIPGQLPAKYNFNYGTDESGSIRNAPLTLPNPK